MGASGWDLAALAVVVLVALAGTVAAAFLWRGRGFLIDQAPPWFPYGLGVWQGLLRGGPTLVLALWLGVLAFLIAVTTDPDSIRWGVVLVMAGLLSLVLGFLVVPSIALFNRPRFAVPPPLRDQLGLWQAWRSSKSTGDHSGDGRPED